MILEIYSIFDVKMKVFSAPFFSQGEVAAKRSVMSVLREDGPQRSMLSLFPDDYDLYRLGHFDDQVGVITPLSTPFCVCKCGSLMGGSNASQS